MGVISQAPELLECEIGITLFGYPVIFMTHDQDDLAQPHWPCARPADQVPLVAEDRSAEGVRDQTELGTPSVRARSATQR